MNIIGLMEIYKLLKGFSFFEKNKVGTCIILFAICCSCNNNSANSDILYATSNELTMRFSENKELVTVYKDRIFQITGEIIHAEQAIDNILSKNQSAVYFGERDGQKLIAKKLIVCYFDINTLGWFAIGDTVTIQGQFKEVDNTGTIIFERSRIVKPAFEPEVSRNSKTDKTDSLK